MMTQEERHKALVYLKQVVREHSPFHGAKSAAFSLLEDGVPEGALTEVQSRLGGGATEALVQFLKEHPSKRAAWIESERTVFPTALFQRGVAPSQIAFVETGETSDMMWAALECLRSQLFGVVVLNDFAMNERDLKRLQMAAERSGSHVFLVSHAATPASAWTYSLQMSVLRPDSHAPLDEDLEQPRLNLQMHRRRQSVGTTSIASGGAFAAQEAI